MTYNALDNLESAYELRSQLILELEDMRASIEYERAVDHEDMDEEEEYAQRITDVIKAITAYIGGRVS